jgi:heme exporter protein CcmD
MDLAAKHVGFVLASYAVAFVAIGGLIAAVWLRARRVSRRLEELERLGAPRRRRMAQTQNDDAGGSSATAADPAGETGIADRQELSA